ncbi:hypothetical protein IGL98_001379 [Enterococcus sp. DIV0840]
MKKDSMEPYENKYVWFFLYLENIYLSKSNWENIIINMLSEYDDDAIMYILEKLTELNNHFSSDLRSLLKTKRHSLYSEGALFKDLKIKNDLHPKFVMLKENDEFIFHRKILNTWFEGFEDRDGKIVKEFQTTFHSSFWEIFLYKIFKDLGYSIDFTKNRPDFILKNQEYENREIYVEATISNISINGRKEDNRGLEDILGMMTPPHLNEEFDDEIEEAVVRYSSAIKTKLEKYKNDYTNLKWVKNENPYVIALSSYSQVNYGREYIFGIIALLYGLYYSKIQKKFIKRDYVEKKEGVKIPIGIFELEEYSDVSAIIFTSNLTIGKLTALIKSQVNYKSQEVFNLYQDFTDDDMTFKINMASIDSAEVLTDGVWVLHNPLAKNKLNLKEFYEVGITNFFEKDKEYYVYGNLNPTISRLDIPNILVPRYIKRITSMTELYNSHENLDFIDYYILPDFNKIV